MIDRAYITEWQQTAPWSQRYQVEQDLIICRVLVEIFNHPLLTEQLAFRGGTALFKLHLPPARYSEDIDLVQVEAGPIGPVMDALQEKLNPWLGVPKRKQSEGRVTLTYRMESEEGLPLKLKVEINSREHFSVLGLERRQFSVESRWFSGSTTILTYQLDELLGTKVRALYQRKKGRDLFDLWKAFSLIEINPAQVVDCFLRYMEHEGHRVSRAEFEMNLGEKLRDPRFLEDIGPLLMRNSGWDLQKAAEFVMNELVARLPGEAWQGGKTDE
ncbi:nucleotidyl transferase AbiEii/AbiGii toxin family protein [Geobacter benzoatilyticus]|uniref:Nucleotidyl transferase AbiEii/AbiGii toxin family protein n=1 Tax=Geobacter benzoatilyticus TaxID=2815309 RepID=A0ABX7Q2X5_9BACT|nr:nucleotidyl transferase AbiEii/AbiGii toxin family protein [Geobacter benzoatilyticus]QSV45428.1 nucleotidyl transferase AbiEii/AbiGii toxin family protein [Geobacter benzoatilyticus]